MNQKPRVDKEGNIFVSAFFVAVHVAGDAWLKFCSMVNISPYDYCTTGGHRKHKISKKQADDLGVPYEH